MRKRYLRKRKRYSEPWERYGTDDPWADKNRVAPDAEADLRRLQDVVFGLLDTYGEEETLEMVKFATLGFSASQQKRIGAETLVYPLLGMPGEKNRGKLARMIAAENEKEGAEITDQKAIQRRINDALHFLRCWQSETGIFLILGGVFCRKRLYRKLGITYWGPVPECEHALDRLKPREQRMRVLSGTCNVCRSERRP
jgi:hypothetical protein